MTSRIQAINPAKAPNAEPGNKRLAHVSLQTVKLQVGTPPHVSYLWYILASSGGYSVHAIDSDCENATQRALDDLALLLRSGDVEPNPGPDVTADDVAQWYTIIRGKPRPAGKSPLYESFVSAICFHSIDVEDVVVEKDQPFEGVKPASTPATTTRQRRPKPQKQPKDDEFPNLVPASQAPKRPADPVARARSRREKRDAYIVRMKDFTLHGVCRFLRLFSSPADASALLEHAASCLLGSEMALFLQGVAINNTLGEVMDVMFPESQGYDNSWLGVMADLRALDLCALGPAVKKEDWSAIAQAIANHKMHALNGNIDSDDLYVQQSFTVPGGTPNQVDVTLFTNTAPSTRTWNTAHLTLAGGWHFGLDVSTLIVYGVSVGSAPPSVPQNASALSPAANWVILKNNFLAKSTDPAAFNIDTSVVRLINVPPGHSVFFSVRRNEVSSTKNMVLHLLLHCATAQLYGDHNHEMHAINGNVTNYDHVQADKHNHYMHALHGNTDALASAEAVAAVGVPPPVRAAPAVVESGKPESRVPTFGALPSLLEKIERTFGDDGFLHAPCNAVASVGIGLSQYAKTFKPVYFNQGGLSGVAYDGYHESYFSEIGALAEDDSLTLQRRYSSVFVNDRHTSLAQLQRSQADFVTNTATGNITGLSQYIRVNTSTFSGDARSRIMLADAASILAGNVGSMAVPLARLLLYSVSEVPLLGPEFCQAVGNTQCRLDYGGGGAPRRILENKWWDLSSAHAMVVPAIEARFISLTDLAQMRSGAAGQRALTVPAGWEMGEWGRSVAIVPLVAAMTNASVALCAWTLAFMEYPYRGVTWATEVSDDSGNTTVAANLHPMANSVRLQGPTAKVLFVSGDTLSPDASLNIGSIIPVTLTYAANGFGPAAVSQVIGSTLNAEFANADNWRQAVTEAQQWWRTVLGSVEDEFAAFIMAADHSFCTAPNPHRTRATVAFAHASQTSVAGDLPAWTAGYTFVTAATVAQTLSVLGSSSTHPVDPFIDVDIGTVRAGVQRVASLGQYDGVMAAYLAGRVIEPQHPSRPMSTTNIVQVVWTLRELAAALGGIVDEGGRQVGIGMEEMLAPALVGANQMQAVALRAWSAVLGVVNEHLLKRHGAPARYYHTATTALAKPFYNVAIDHTMPWHRAPVWMLPGAASRLPKGYASPGTTWSVAYNYPAPGDVTEIWPPRTSVAPEDVASWIAAAAVINPTNPLFAPFDLQIVLASKEGAVIQNLYLPASHPSIGQWVQRVLADAQPIPISTASWVDWPMYPVMPKYSARYLQERRPMAFGALVNYIRAKGVRVLNLRLPSDAGFQDLPPVGPDGLDPFEAALAGF